MKVARERDTIITMNDVEDLSLDKVAEIALEVAWKGADAVYLSSTSTAWTAASCPGSVVAHGKIGDHRKILRDYGADEF